MFRSPYFPHHKMLCLISHLTRRSRIRSDEAAKNHTSLPSLEAPCRTRGKTQLRQACVSFADEFVQEEKLWSSSQDHVWYLTLHHHHPQVPAGRNSTTPELCYHIPSLLGRVAPRSQHKPCPRCRARRSPGNGTN